MPTTPTSTPIDASRSDPHPSTFNTTSTHIQVRLEGSYLAEAVEVTGPNPADRRPIPLSLRPPRSTSSSSSSSPWDILAAYSPLPPTTLLMAAGVAVLLLGVLLVVVGGGIGKGGGNKAD